MASFAAIVGGTALDFFSGGAIGSIGGVLAGLMGNVAADDAAAQWASLRSKPRYSYPNHDLTRLVGAGIARVLYDCAEEGNNRSWFIALAEAAEQHYLDIAALPALDQIRGDRIVELFESAAMGSEMRTVPLLNELFLQVHGENRTVSWAVVEFLRDKSNRERNVDAIQHAESRIISGLFLAIREMFKRDFAGNGRAYAALCLDTSAQLLARLSYSNRLQEMTGRQVRALRAGLDDRLTCHYQQLSDEQRRSMTLLLDEVKSVRDQLDLLLNLATRTDDRTLHIERRTERIESRIEQIADGLLQKLSAQSEVMEELRIQLLGALRRAEDAESRGVESAMNVVRNLRLSGDSTQLAAFLDDQLSSLDSTAVELLLERGAVALTADDLTKAESCFREVLRRLPSDPSALHNLLVVLVRGQKIQDAELLVSQMEMDTLEQRKEVLSMRAWMYSYVRNWALNEDAVKQLIQAYEEEGWTAKNVTGAINLLTMANLLKRRGDLDGARSSILRATQLYRRFGMEDLAESIEAGMFRDAPLG